jgi:hypothetical protein
VLHSRIETTLQYLPDIDSDRTKEILLAHLDSPLVEDRSYAAMHFALIGLMRVDPDEGLPIWDRMIRDSDRSHVANEAYSLLYDWLCESAGRAALNTLPPRAEGMYLLDVVDEAQLEANCGLNRESAYGLMESYAYAENGLYVYDLGREALNKIAHPSGQS